MRRPVIVGLGELLWDVYPDARHLGGATANVAVHARRLGAEGIIASAVGEDEDGDALIERIKAWGMDASHVQICRTHPTGTVRVTLDGRGVPSFSCSWDTAFDHLSYDDSMRRLASAADGVAVGTFDQRNAVGRDTTQKFLADAGSALKVFDVNFRGWDEKMEGIVRETLEHADVLKFALDEMLKMRDAFRRKDLGVVPFLMWIVNRFGLKLAALSLGERGCILTDGEDAVMSPGVRVDAVDTTGCGDAFVAGLMLKILEGSALGETAEFANHLGAFVATKPGATPEYSAADVERFRAERPHRTAFDLDTEDAG